MNATGTNTAQRISAMATTGPETSCIAFFVAETRSMRFSMWCITASTTMRAPSGAATKPPFRRTVTWRSTSGLPLSGMMKP